MAGMVIGCLAAGAGLLASVADVVRGALVVASCLALALRIGLVPRNRADAHPLVVLLPAFGATAAACVALVTQDPHSAGLVVLAGLTCAAACSVEMLIARAWIGVANARDRIRRSLDVPVRVVQGEDTFEARPSDVRSGEQMVVFAGETIGVDATVAAGEACIVPWLDARDEVVKREGDAVVAGARVRSRQLRLIATWSGRDRAWTRLFGLETGCIDANATTARALRHVVERGAPLAALLVGIAAFVSGATAVEILAAMCAAVTAFAAKAAASVVALHFARAHLDALANGITYKDPRAFERAASANVAVLSARGTVLLGEPEIVAVEPAAGFDVERVIAFAAGAEMASTHPFAAAVLRAARARGVRPDHVRNAKVHSGLGVTACASSGERLVVGGRAIMLEEKIGVAMFDARVSELECQGRSVLLVALGHRLAGIIALQDGLRAGTRAAVQLLLDASIEPVLLSGEARETCETIGRALDIEHVRPEVMPADRGTEVRALAESGNVVAVIGYPAIDDGALGAADVAVAMAAAGSTPGEWAVALAGDQLREAALALTIPRAAGERARMAMAIGATPGLVALLAVAFGVAPLAVAPVAALLGATAVMLHARERPSGIRAHRAGG
jgi:cation transport ATPase